MLLTVQAVFVAQSVPLREAFQTKKRGTWDLVQIGGGGGVIKKTKKSQVSVGTSSQLGGSSEIKKLPSSRGNPRLKK